MGPVLDQLVHRLRPNSAICNQPHEGHTLLVELLLVVDELVLSKRCEPDAWMEGWGQLRVEE